jgi:serine/threonine protein kinase
LNKPIPFGKYYLLERINVGGMAEVFKAKTVGVEGFERIVALKRILPSIAEDEEFITMFIDEAKIAVQLQHANIAQIFDLGKVDDSYFIALEYVNGRDLRGIFDDLRKRGQVMPMQQVCYLIMQLCEGLDYAHNKRDAQGRDLNLVHRDVSPQNVLIGYDGEVKLIDFGIAKAAGKASKTQAGILKGKFGYMSPEQVRGLPIDRRSDIFALGIVLYEMLTGERLFIGETDFSTLEKVRNVEIIPPSSFNAGIPEKLERIVLKALEKNVEDRYQNAIDLHDDLQLFMHSVGQFSSRKDLSAWMKRTFAEEMPSEGAAADLDDVQEIDSAELIPSASAERTGVSRAVPKEEEFGWDEEERETQIFDKDPEQVTVAENSFLADGGDKTVAMPPSEALLAEMGDAFDTQVPTEPKGQPGAARQELIRRGVDPDATPPPAPTLFPSLSLPGPGVSRKSGSVPVASGGGSPFDLPKPVFRQTLLGGSYAPTLPTANAAPGPVYPTFQPAPMAPAAGPGMPQQMFPSSAFPGMPVPSPSPAYAPTVDIYAAAGSPNAFRQPSRLKYYVIFFLLMIAGGGGTYMVMTRPGHLQVAVKPQDARLAVDGVVITSDPPFHLDKRPGVYRLTVSRPGYIAREQNVQISAGQAGHLDIDLEPSPDTGFDLTSQPSGGRVWLDSQPLVIDENGTQATTNFHASRIAPGPHVIEISGNAQYQTWRQEFQQEPNRTVRLHADLVPVAGGKPAATKSAPPAVLPSPTGSPPAVQPPPSGFGLAEKKAPRAGGHRSGTALSSRSTQQGAPAGGPGDDVFDSIKPSASDKKPKPAPSAGSDDDIFESHGKADSSGGGTCVATISSKPWAEVSIDGKPTGKITPLVNYPIPCGKHRVTFKNADLMIERNESVTLKAGQPFKKIFSLVENEL